MCGPTCFGRLSAHHQEHSSALGASGFTAGEKRLERCWSWSGRLLLKHVGATHKRQVIKLVKLLHLVGWIIWIIWWCTGFANVKLSQLTHTKYSESVQWMQMYSSNNHKQEISFWIIEDTTYKYLHKFFRFSGQLLIRCWFCVSAQRSGAETQRRRHLDVNISWVQDVW
jgi:hypothetical protein